MQDNDARLKVVAEKLRTSIKQLCDKLKDNPNVAENMAKIASERQQLQVCYQQASAYFRLHLQLPALEFWRTREQSGVNTSPYSTLHAPHPCVGQHSLDITRSLMRQQIADKVVNKRNVSVKLSLLMCKPCADAAEQDTGRVEHWEQGAQHLGDCLRGAS